MKNAYWSLFLALVVTCNPAKGQTSPPLPTPEILTESEVFTLVPPDNGSGPLWSFGCTQIVRTGDDVYVSAMETGPDIPLLCNTRWRLLKREGDSWRMIAQDERYRQREPCSIAVLSPTRLALYVNDSLEAPGVKYGKCLPILRVFHLPGDPPQQYTITPNWAGPTNFTDHSYRGYAADPAHERALMLNIDAKTSVQHACLLSVNGETLATGSITFPIRSCYPQVALSNYEVRVLAIGDIVEPVETWRQYKFEQTKQAWDYVFRRLFYTWTPDLRTIPFQEPVEVDSVDATGGSIMNQDLWTAADGEAWILYTRREVQSALLRDKFFPDKSILPALYLARISGNTVTHKTVLLPENENASVSQARFHITPDGAVYVVLHLTGTDSGVKLLRLLPEDPARTLIPVSLSHPLAAFCLAGIRAGNAPSNIIDLFGSTGDTVYRYAAIRIHPSKGTQYPATSTPPAK